MDTQKATIPLQIVVLISPVIYFQVQSFHLLVQSSVQSRCVQYPPNDPLPILREKVGGQGWEGGKSRHLTKVVNHCVTSDKAGETRGGVGGCCKGQGICPSGRRAPNNSFRLKAEGKSILQSQAYYKRLGRLNLQH